MRTGKARLWCSGFLPAVVALLSLGSAVGAGVVVGSGTAAVVTGVEGLSAASSALLGSAAVLIPLGYAFGAGMVSTVNPCGFAMLPAYLGLYLGTAEEGGRSSSVPVLLLKALLIAAVVSAGFVVLFGVVGLLFATGARSIAFYFPWMGLTIGLLLLGAGAWLLHGGTLYSNLAGRVAVRLGNPSRVGIRGYFLFGLSYGTASLSCTLPIFLTVVGTTLAAGGLLVAASQFIMYALGMGMVILVLTLGMAIFKGAVVGPLRRALPYIQPASAVLLLLAGSYIVFFWLTVGGLLARLGL